MAKAPKTKAKTKAKATKAKAAKVEVVEEVVENPIIAEEPVDTIEDIAPVVEEAVAEINEEIVEEVVKKAEELSASVEPDADAHKAAVVMLRRLMKKGYQRRRSVIMVERETGVKLP